MPDPQASAGHAQTSSEETIFSLGDSLRSWGGWGDQDERGALNYITPDHRVAAAGLVRRGAVFSLSLPIRDGQGPTRPYPVGRFSPFHRSKAAPYARAAPTFPSRPGLPTCRRTAKVTAGS